MADIRPYLKAYEDQEVHAAKLAQVQTDIYIFCQGCNEPSITIPLMEWHSKIGEVVYDLMKKG